MKLTMKCIAALLSLGLLLPQAGLAQDDTIVEGIRLLEADHLGAAQEFFSTFSEQNPGNSLGQFYLGRVAFERNELGEAPEVLREEFRALARELRASIVARLDDPPCRPKMRACLARCRWPRMDGRNSRKQWS